MYIFYIRIHEDNLCKLNEEQEAINLRGGHGKSWEKVGRVMI